MIINTLFLGLIAALAWGVHDVFVRFISQRAAILPTLLAVLIAGGVLAAPVTLLAGDWAAMTGQAILAAIGAGLLFAFASYSLYQAFSIGPVRLVSPLIASYPVLSVSWASATGASTSAGEWIAVLLTIAGVAIVARGVGNTEADQAAQAPDANDARQQRRQRRRAIIWSLMAGFGFAATFFTGQTAAQMGAELPVILVTRLAAIATIAAALLFTTGFHRPTTTSKRHWLLLCGMGGLDAVALGSVTMSGTMPNPEYASVTSSVFGLITVVLAWMFLKEKMTPTQWGGVIIVFGAIAYLGA